MEGQREQLDALLEGAEAGGTAIPALSAGVDQRQLPDQGSSTGRSARCRVRVVGLWAAVLLATTVVVAMRFANWHTGAVAGLGGGDRPLAVTELSSSEAPASPSSTPSAEKANGMAAKFTSAHAEVTSDDGAEDDKEDKSSTSSTPSSTSTTKPLACAGESEDCTHSKCCSGAGMQCYVKNPFWAQCKESCTVGPDPTDVDETPWNCTRLGSRAPGSPPQCAATGASCSESKCCSEVGMTCFAKNDTYAACKGSCSPGPDYTDPDCSDWKCEALGKQTPGQASWVASKCAPMGQDCSHQQCCVAMGHQCFKKSQFYATCMESCTPGVNPQMPWDGEWSCEALGTKTPGLAYAAVQAPAGKVQPWVEEKCDGEADDCTESKCCIGVGQQCFVKNKHWAQCKDVCSKEPDPNDNNATWDCTPLGSRSWGLAVKGYPSLFCYSVMRQKGYEPGLVRAHLHRGIGIFGCDGYVVLADAKFTLGKDLAGKEVVTIPIPKIKVGISQDGTAANAKLFMAAWDAIIRNGRYRNHDWTLKVDPDAVLLADRMRLHMLPHNGENVYVVNCNAFPTSPNFPMMYGATEVFSLAAMKRYAEGSWKCGQQLPWHAWGEDYFMTHCMDMLGVGRILDTETLGDNMCTGANCANGWTASFHPFKDVESWMNCFDTATKTPKPE